MTDHDATRHTPRDIADAWLGAFNRKDLAALLALYGEDAVHTSPKLREREPETGGRVCGKEALRAWFAGAFERLPQLYYEAEHVTAGDARVVLEYKRHNPGDPVLRVAEVFACRGGVIVESHVYHG